MKIADIIRGGIADGKTNDEILAAVMKEHPDANTNAACVNWYRNKAKKSASAVIERAKTEAPRPAAAPIAVGNVWSAKITRTFRGMEGGGFNAELLLNGKVVCLVIDDAHGGPYMYEWKDERTAEPVGGKHRRYDGTFYERRMTPLEKKFHDHINALPKYEAFGHEAWMTEDCFVGELLEELELAKELKRLTKGKVAFLTLDNKVFTVKCQLDAKSKAAILAKHKGAVILNELTEKDAVARLRIVAQG
jgi:hypothetical protein